MKSRAGKCLAAVFLSCGFILRPPPTFAEKIDAPAVTAFVSVNLLPMDSDRVSPDQTVLVEGHIIRAIGKSIPIPKNARVIDGHGQAFLLPGLADMHTHSDTSEEMKVYLANGVTTVLNMGNASFEFIAQVRPLLNEGKRPGPHVYAAFRVDGTPRYGQFVVKTPEQARCLVGLAKINGYNFIKVYNNLSPECFQAFIDEGRREQLPVIGHGLTRVGLKRQIEAGQVMVAHTEEFLYTFFAHPNEPPTDAAPDRKLIPGAIELVKSHHAFVTADLNTYGTIARQWGKPEVIDRIMQAPEVPYLAPRNQMEWKKEDYIKRKGSLEAKLEFLKVFTKAMSEAGVNLIAGTDAPGIPGLVPGYSLHDDLDALRNAGMKPYAVLSTATREPGEFIDRFVPGAEKFGTITVGSRADLLLAAKNPLEDLSTLRRPLGVMADGNWRDADDLQHLLDEVAQEYESVK